MNYILPLHDPQASLDTVGGKGASLARLANAGLPVPAAFHITTAAYQQFVSANGLQPHIIAAARGVSPNDPAALDAAAQAIHVLFERAVMPPDIADAIAQAYAALSAGGAGLPVAVRSSATAEDLPGLSFAGQQETFLNVCGTPAVLEAVKRCWASLWTARAIGYRQQHHVDQESVSLAVVVQTLVCAEAAGVLFTAHPVSGQRGQALLTATWGLGEAIVGGLVTPDSLTLDKASGRVLLRETADKQVMTVRTETGTHEAPVPEARRRAPVLADQQAAELVRLGVQIEQHYGMPMDIEWTLAGGQFAIVQARPITALPEPEPSVPAEWTLPDPKRMYFRGSITEQLPDPLTPLFATLGREIISAGSARLFNMIMGPGTAQDDFILTINGYAYYGMRLRLRLVWGMLSGLVKFWPEFTHSEQRWRDAHARYVEVINRWQGRPAGVLTGGELLEAVHQLMAETVNIYNILQSGILGLASGAEVLFTAVYDRLAKRRGDPPAATLLLGFDSLPIQAEKSLYDLAQQGRACPDLAEYLLRTPAAQLANELSMDQPPAGLSAGDWHAWQQGFNGYLQQYGHVIYDLDFAKPLPADDPAPLLETYKLYLSGRGTNPHERQQSLASRREQLAQAVSGRMGGLRLKLFRKTLGWARTYGPLREDSLADLGLGYPLLRQLLHELGGRLHRAGMISKPEDIYWLSEDEAAQGAAALDAGQGVNSLADEVGQRKALWRSQKRLTPPTALPVRSRMSRALQAVGPARTDQAAGSVLRGAGASQGCFTGTARVLHGPEDFGQMQAGEVLVAAVTTPAWTPLFAMASAIVTDVGGPLSHGSIVAREYGIPAVLGTGVATRRIQTGQVITVDGTAGTVTLARMPESAAAAPALEWKLPRPKGQYMRAGVVDLMPDPLSPLFATCGIPALVSGAKKTIRELVRSEPVLPSDYFTTINGFAYMGVKYSAREVWWLVSRMMTAILRMAREGIPYWREKAQPRYAEAVARWQDQALESMPPADLWRGANDLLTAAMDYLGALMVSTMGVSAGAELTFTQVYQKLVKKAGDPPPQAYLLGYDSTPIRAEKSLYDLAQWCRQQPALAEYLLARSGEEVVTQLQSAALPAGQEPAAWHAFGEQLQNHLRQYGHIIFTLDPAQPLPLDHPAPMIETVRMYLRGEGVDPHQRQHAAEEKRIQSGQAMLARLRGPRRWAFSKALAWSQSLAEVRETAIAGIGLGYPTLRRILRELGRRLTEAGALAAPEDVFWLELAEAEAAVAALESHTPLASLTARVEAHRAAWQAAKRVSPPPMLPPARKYMGFDVGAFVPESGDSQTGNTLKGVPTSAGRVTAPARVLHGPEDFGQMRSGEVLVAAITTPAWTPLFAMASAVVTDVGGPLSHGSIVAREYNIPAVMGTGVATRRIRSGQVITVDGSAGTVNLPRTE